MHWEGEYVVGGVFADGEVSFFVVQVGECVLKVEWFGVVDSCWDSFIAERGPGSVSMVGEH